MKRLFRNFFGADSQEASLDGQRATQDSNEYTDGSSYSYTASDEDGTSSKATTNAPSSKTPIPHDHKKRDGNQKSLEQRAVPVTANASVPVPLQDQRNKAVDSESSHYSLRLRHNRSALQVPDRRRAGLRLPSSSRAAPIGAQHGNQPESAASNQIATVSNQTPGRRQSSDVAALDFRGAYEPLVPKLPHLVSAKTTSGIIGHLGNVGTADIESATHSALRVMCKDLGVPASGTKEELKKRALSKISKPYYRGEVTQPLGTDGNLGTKTDGEKHQTYISKSMDGSDVNMDITDNRRKTTTTTGVASRSMAEHSLMRAQNLSAPFNGGNVSNPQPLRSDQKVQNSAAELSSTDLFKFDQGALLSSHIPSNSHQPGRSRNHHPTGSPVQGDPCTSVDNTSGSLIPLTAQHSATCRGPAQMTGSGAPSGGPQQRSTSAVQPPTTFPPTTTPTASRGGRPPTAPASKPTTDGPQKNNGSESLLKTSLEGKMTDIVPQQTRTAQKTSNDCARIPADKPSEAGNENREIARKETHLDGIYLQHAPPAQSNSRRMLSNDLEVLDEFSPAGRKLPKAYVGAEGGPQDMNTPSIGPNNQARNPTRPPSIQARQRPATVRIQSAIETSKAHTFLNQPEAQNSPRPALPTLAPVRPTPVRRTLSGFATPSDIIRTFNRYTPRHPMSTSAAKEGAPTPLFKHDSRPSSDRLPSRNFHRLSGSAFGVQLFPDGEQNRRASRWGSLTNFGTPSGSQGLNSKRHSTGMSRWRRRAMSMKGGQLIDLRRSRAPDNPSPLIQLNDLEARNRWKRNDQAVEMASSAKKILEALKRTSRENRELCANRKPLLPLSAPPSLKRARDDQEDLDKVEKRIRRAANNLSSSRRGLLTFPKSGSLVNETETVSPSPNSTRKRNSASISKPSSALVDRKRRLGLAHPGDDEINMKRSSKRRSFSSAQISAFKEAAASSSPTKNELTTKRRGFSSGYSSNIEADFRAFASSDSIFKNRTAESIGRSNSEKSSLNDKDSPSRPVSGDQEKPQRNPFQMLKEKQDVNLAFSSTPSNDEKASASAAQAADVSAPEIVTLNPIQSAPFMSGDRRLSQNPLRKSIVKNTPDGEKRAAKSVTFGPTFTVSHQGAQKMVGFPTSDSHETEMKTSHDQSEKTQSQFPIFTIPKVLSAERTEHAGTEQSNSRLQENKDAGNDVKSGGNSTVGILKVSQPLSLSTEPVEPAQESKSLPVQAAPTQDTQIAEQPNAIVQSNIVDSKPFGGGSSSEGFKKGGFGAVSPATKDLPNPSLFTPAASAENGKEANGLQDEEKTPADANVSTKQGEPTETDNTTVQNNISESVDVAPAQSSGASFGTNNALTVNNTAPQPNPTMNADTSEPSKPAQAEDVSAEKKDNGFSTNVFASPASTNPFGAQSSAVMGTAPAFTKPASQPSAASSMFTTPSAPLGTSATFGAGPFGSSPAFGSSASGFGSSSGGFGSSASGFGGSSGGFGSSPATFGSSTPFGSSSASLGFNSSSSALGSSPAVFGASSGANSMSTASFGAAFNSSTPVASGFQTQPGNASAAANPFDSTPLGSGSGGSFGNSGFPSAPISSGTPFMFGVSGPQSSQQPSFGAAAQTPFGSSTFGTTGGAAPSNPFGSSAASNLSNPFGSNSGAASNNAFGTSGGAGSNNPFGSSGVASSSNRFGSSSVAGTGNPFGATGSSGSNPFGTPATTTPFGGVSGGFGQPNTGLQGSAFGGNVGQPSTGLSAAAQNMFNAPAAGSGNNFSMGTQSQGVRRPRKMLRARRTRR